MILSRTAVFPPIRLVLLFSLMLACSPWLARAAEPQQVTMLLVAPGADHVSHRNGAILGQTEGNIQGRFLGIDYALEQVSVEQASTPVAGISAVVVAAPAAQLLQLREVYAPLRVPVFNIALGDMSLREQCLEGLYHTIPSAKMLADAEAQWQQANPGVPARAEAWHPTFVRFAGRDLNRRYREQFEVEMDSAAWAGWAATRMVAEAVVRTGSADAAGIDAYLRDGLGFDGQKGVAHTFRDTGQLRQPLLLIGDNDEILGDAPVRGAANPNDLDSLGLAACP